jgi:hypothetical protein
MGTYGLLIVLKSDRNAEKWAWWATLAGHTAGWVAAVVVATDRTGEGFGNGNVKGCGRTSAWVKQPSRLRVRWKVIALLAMNAMGIEEAF